MKYSDVCKGIFIERPNRFIAKVLIDDKVETVHVKNTGRCKEILKKGAIVYLQKNNSITRKTAYDLISVEKINSKGKTTLINIDSQIVNYVADEWLKKGGIFSSSAIIKREVTYGSSRFDFYIEDGDRKIFLEVKGVTLENNGVASFPDAPTIRGIKHINELCDSIDNGYEAYILFIIQMKGVKKFTTNKIIHKDFADALSRAYNHGVKILCVDCIVFSDEIYADDYISFEL